MRTATGSSVSIPRSRPPAEGWRQYVVLSGFVYQRHRQPATATRQRADSTRGAKRAAVFSDRLAGGRRASVGVLAAHAAGRATPSGPDDPICNFRWRGERDCRAHASGRVPPGGGLTALRPIDDADFWWLLRAGRYMVETGTFLADPFSRRRRRRVAQSRLGLRVVRVRRLCPGGDDRRHPAWGSPRPRPSACSTASSGGRRTGMELRP